MEHLRRKVVVHGRVQGVWFRESARRRGGGGGGGGGGGDRAHGPVGGEREGGRADGEGRTDWFRRGPSGAQVERLEVEDAVPTGEAGFTVRR